MDKPSGKPRNLFRLAGVINAASTEADLEAGELIERVRRNKVRTLDLITKGHKNETLRELMLAEAEKEHELANLEAAVGDNGGPLLEDTDETEAKIREALVAAKSDPTSKSSEKPAEQPLTSGDTAQAQTETSAASPPEVGQQPFQS